MSVSIQWHEQGYTPAKLISLVGVILVFGAAVFLVLISGQKNPAAPSKPAPNSTVVTSSNPFAVLSPASVASKTAECSQQVSYSSNGNSGPIQCSNGDLNVLEWNTLAALEPSVMTLGYGATAAQVQSALCKDASDSSSDANTSNSNIIEGTTYHIAALYYGWSFSSDPSAVLSNGTC
jgi:hypothetical protein